MIDSADVARNVGAVRARIDEAARRAGTSGERVTLIAVTKTFGLDAVLAALDAGCLAIGENYAQELVAKMAGFPDDRPRPTVHFIGRLQSNKIRLLAPCVDVWQTIDRVGVIDELARRAPGARIFVQVNVDDDPDKGGCAPSDAPALVERAVDQGLAVEGLMTIGRQGTAEQVSVGFSRLRSLADELGLAGCSMGMSGDIEAAVAAGATHVRVGSALFGQRVRQLGGPLG